MLANQAQDTRETLIALMVFDVFDVIIRTHFYCSGYISLIVYQNVARLHGILWMGGLSDMVQSSFVISLILCPFPFSA